MKGIVFDSAMLGWLSKVNGLFTPGGKFAQYANA